MLSLIIFYNNQLEFAYAQNINLLFTHPYGTFRCQHARLPLPRRYQLCLLPLRLFLPAYTSPKQFPQINSNLINNSNHSDSRLRFMVNILITIRIDRNSYEDFRVYMDNS
jgi:hypothetical protein